MHSRVRLTRPLKINVAKIASYFPELRYRGPFTGETSEWIVNDANSEKQQVLLFDDKSEVGFNTIRSSCSPKELAALFSRLPADLSTVLIEALKGTKLAIPTISEHEQKEIMAAHERQKKCEEKLHFISGPLKETKAVDFKSSEALKVFPHEYAITTATSTQPIVGSSNAEYSVILALYDTANKTAVLAHIDEITTIDSIGFNCISG